MIRSYSILIIGTHRNDDLNLLKQGRLKFDEFQCKLFGFVQKNK